MSHHDLLGVALRLGPGTQGRLSSRQVLRRGLLVTPWLLRSRRNRLAAELGHHPLTRTDRCLLAAALAWSVTCSVACGALVVALGAEARVAAAAVAVGVLMAALLTAGAAPRTRTVGLVRSTYRQEGPWRGASAVALVVADAAARLVSLLSVLLVVLGPALVVVLSVQWGGIVAFLLVLAVVLLALTAGLVASVGSLLRLGAGSRLAVSVGYHADLLVRAAGAGAVAGCGAYVVGRVVRTTDASVATSSLLRTDVTVLDAMLLLGGATALAVACLVLLAQVAGSATLERSLQRLAQHTERADGGGRPTSSAQVAEHVWEVDALRAKERALVRRTRTGRGSAADGLVAVSSALVGGVVGLASSGLVTSPTARLTAFLFGLLLMGEFVGDGLRRINSVDADGAATTWLLVSRKHLRRLVRLRAVRHARTLTIVVGSVLAVTVCAVSLIGVQIVLVGVAGGLVVVVSTVSTVGTTARSPRWDWASVEEIGMHPAAQALRLAATGVLWMIVFCLAAVGHHLSVVPTDAVIPGLVLPLGAASLCVLLGRALAPRAVTTLGRSI